MLLTRAAQGRRIIFAEGSDDVLQQLEQLPEKETVAALEQRSKRQGAL